MAKRTKGKTRGKRLTNTQALESMSENLEQKLAPTSDTEIFGGMDATPTTEATAEEKTVKEETITTAAPTEVSKPQVSEDTSSTDDSEGSVIDKAIRSVQSADDVLKQLQQAHSTPTKAETTEEATSTEKKIEELNPLYLRKEFDKCNSFDDLSALGQQLSNVCEVNATNEIGKYVMGTYLTTFERLVKENHLKIAALDAIKEKGLTQEVLTEVQDDISTKLTNSTASKTVKYTGAKEALEVFKCWVK